MPLAMVAMDALESWSRSLPSHLMKKHYRNILPCLETYLKTVEQGEFMHDKKRKSSFVLVTKSLGYYFTKAFIQTTSYAKYLGLNMS